MTKKYYQKIAEALMRSRSIIASPDQDVLYAEIVNQIAVVLKNDNSRFSIDRFKDACYPKVTTLK